MSTLGWRRDALAPRSLLSPIYMYIQFSSTHTIRCDYLILFFAPHISLLQCTWSPPCNVFVIDATCLFVHHTDIYRSAQHTKKKKQEQQSSHNLCVVRSTRWSSSGASRTGSMAFCIEINKWKKKKTEQFRIPMEFNMRQPNRDVCFVFCMNALSSVFTNGKSVENTTAAVETRTQW